MLYIILIILNIIILSSGYVVYKRKLQQKIDKESKKYIEENKQILQTEVERQIDYLKLRERALSRDVAKKWQELETVSDQIVFSNKQLQELNSTLTTQRESAKSYEETLREQARQASTAYEVDLRKLADLRVGEYEQEKLKAAELLLAEKMGLIASQTNEARAQLEQMVTAINEYSAKQAAINEAIMRQRAIEEQQDFYRVCLAPDTANDVEVLNNARRNLKKPEIIDKIIYDNYIAKPVLEMVKRVLQNTTCSGIYKITCLKTGEIYIGKSTDIKNRWQQHCKTVFNCGTIASSLLHTKMKQHGIENFTFELVETVPKDQLSEREKFYINFYQTKEVGLNERNG